MVCITSKCITLLIFLFWASSGYGFFINLLFYRPFKNYVYMYIVQVTVRTKSCVYWIFLYNILANRLKLKTVQFQLPKSQLKCSSYMHQTWQTERLHLFVNAAARVLLQTRMVFIRNTPTHSNSFYLEMMVLVLKQNWTQYPQFQQPKQNWHLSCNSYMIYK